MQPPAVGAVLAAQHHHDIGLLSQLLDGVLTVGRCVTDVFLRRTFNMRDLFFKSHNDSPGFLNAQRRLGQIGDFGTRFK